MALKATAEFSLSVYTWQIPGRDAAAVELPLEFVDLLGAEILRGYGRVPKRGAEVGGLLLGTIEPDGAATRVLLKQFVPVPTEYKYGPSYLLSDKDRARFSALAAETAGQLVDGLQVVGLYRSNTREVFTLTDEDARLLDQYCPSPEAVFLLVKPSATRTPEAAILMRVDGELPTTPPRATFPFRRKTLEAGPELILNEPPAPAAPLPVVPPRQATITIEPKAETPSTPELPAVSLPFSDANAHTSPSTPIRMANPNPASAAEPSKSPWLPPRYPRNPEPIAPPAAAPVLTVEAQQRFAEELQYENAQALNPLLRGDAWQQARASSLAALDYAAWTRERRRRLVRMAVGAVLFLLLGAFVGNEIAQRNSTPKVSKPVYYEFGLQAERQPHGIAITWDGRAPGVREAAEGWLTIHDGENEKRTHLTASDLEKGVVLYHNSTPQVRVRLEVPQGQHSTLIENYDLKWDAPQQQSPPKTIP